MTFRRSMTSSARDRARASIALATSRAAAQDDAQVKKGREVYTAQKCQVCHTIAGKGSKANPLDGVGAKLSADDIRQWITHPTEMTAKAKSTKKPPMPTKYGSAAGRGPRRARRLHAEPEVGSIVTRREALVRHPLAIAGVVITTVVGRAVHHAADRGARGDARPTRTRAWSSSSPFPRCSSSGLLLIPRGRVAAAPGAAARPQRRRRLAGRRLPDRRGPPDGAAHHRRSPPSTSSSCCWPATAACTGWSRRRSADRPATRRCSRSSRRGRPVRTRGSPASTATSAKAPAGSSTRSWPACGSSSHVATNSYPRPIPPGAAMPPGAQAQTCGSCHQPGRAGRRSHPRHPRIRRRRSEYRDDHHAADARGRVSSSSPGPPSTGTPIPASASSTWRPMPSARRFRTSR